MSPISFSDSGSLPGRHIPPGGGGNHQGLALEILSRSIEYLKDSRMYMIHQSSTRAEVDAVTILAKLSRLVFAECSEIATPINL